MLQLNRQQSETLVQLLLDLPEPNAALQERARDTFAGCAAHERIRFPNAGETPRPICGRRGGRGRWARIFFGKNIGGG
jgi:hypothetical protein